MLIYKAATPAQQTVQGTLADIAQQALPDRPALFIVGAVAGLREHLRWFDTRPLFGRRIVVTRSREQGGELVRLLEELGAEAIVMPTIKIVPVDDLAEMDAACDSAETFDWLVFTSVNGVEHFMRALPRAPRHPRSARACASAPSGPKPLPPSRVTACGWS